MFILNTLSPYEELPDDYIQYTVYRDFDHISRYRNLRQVVHLPEDTTNRYIALEVPNPIQETNLDFAYHEVTPNEENRLDVISYNYYGTASYSWVISYFNDIQDGYTVHPGQTLKMPKNISSLMTTGNMLQSVTALRLNLGTE